MKDIKSGPLKEFVGMEGSEVKRRMTKGQKLQMIGNCGEP